MPATLYTENYAPFDSELQSASYFATWLCLWPLIDKLSLSSSFINYAQADLEDFCHWSCWIKISADLVFLDDMIYLLKLVNRWNSWQISRLWECKSIWSSYWLPIDKLPAFFAFHAARSLTGSSSYLSGLMRRLSAWSRITKQPGVTGSNSPVKQPKRPYNSSGWILLDYPAEKYTLRTLTCACNSISS